MEDNKDHASISRLKTPAEEFNLKRVSKAQVEELSKNINIRKATGCDQIPARALKEGYSSLSLPISSLINKVITTGEVPSTWKHGEVLPSFKCEGPMDKTNYRPVTILPAISKVFEKSVCPQLTAHIEAIFSGFLTAYRKQV